MKSRLKAQGVIASDERLQQSAQFVKGVGPARAQVLNRLNIVTIEDVLYFLPRRYEDRTNLKAIRQILIGQVEMVQGIVSTMRIRRIAHGREMISLVVSDRTGQLQAVWFNQPYLRTVFRQGDHLILHGKVTAFRRPQMVNPDFEIIARAEPKTPRSPPLELSPSISLHMGRIVPIYPLTQDLYQKSIRQIVWNAIAQYGGEVEELLPVRVRARAQLMPIADAIQEVHFPKGLSSLELAKKRLIFDEFFLLQVGMAIRRRQVKLEERSGHHELQGPLIEGFKRSLPFPLTEAQQKVIGQIERDLISGRPMHRLLQGDVGSGKTIVAMWALVITVQNGFQGMIMAPTEILAQQHYLLFSRMLMPLGINCALLVSGQSPQEREAICQGIASGEVDIAIGTHALIQEGLQFKQVGLGVVDEQHKFGVLQRKELIERGLSPKGLPAGQAGTVPLTPHVLVMTATPIPRTLAMTLYGDLDVSVLDELPPGRQPIRTYWVGEAKRQDVYHFIVKQVNQGRQAYVVYPLVEGGGWRVKGGEMLQSAKAMYQEFQANVFPNLRVGLLHGQMGAKEKDAIMQRVKQAKIDILVATTVIEVGIDIPNASVMVIEHADRFGLSQLHQLRGRIGRGPYESYCILLADPTTQTARQRLEAMVQTQDGFRLAEVDLKLRGPGEFFGMRQSGLPELRIANLVTDLKILELAKQEAFQLIARDPYLRDPQHAMIRRTLTRKLPFHLDLALVG